VTDLAYAVIAVFGPTASGKSAVAQELATRLGTEVVSADALQVYDGIPVLTNQAPTSTRLTAIRTLSDEMSVGEYAALAHSEIDELVASHGCAVVAGGTGLYLRAAIADLAIPAAVHESQRAELERLYDADPDAAHERLARLDPTAAARVHANDRRRVVRALELAAAGETLASPRDALWSGETRHPTLVVGLDVPTSELDRRIEERARRMVDDGVQDEARAALARPLSTTAAKIMGLREAAELPPDEAVAALAATSRRLARYQRKWLRRIPALVTLPADRPADEVADAILEMARAR